MPRGKQQGATSAGGQPIVYGPSFAVQLSAADAQADAQRVAGYRAYLDFYNGYRVSRTGCRLRFVSDT